MLLPLATSGTNITYDHFWNTIFLYHGRPHLVNRKIAGTSESDFYKVYYNNNSIKLTECFQYIAVKFENDKIQDFKSINSNLFLTSLLHPYDKSAILIETTIEDVKQSVDGVFICLRILYASNIKCKHCIEIIIFDKSNNTVMFSAASEKDTYALIAPPFAYTIELEKTGHVRFLVDFQDADTTSAEWLIDKLFSKFVKWAEEYDQFKIKSDSLQLISVSDYCEAYRNMKQKYGKKLIEIWPENTDPLKFVYEDIAIASYLICLWKHFTPKEHIKFVDLGCGNGLLVYLLSQENYYGIGLDVRKRKIWNMYPKMCHLEEKTIIPSDSALFPDADWIIGNHSDELTPWIPVIAARSSRQTNYFLLPCCSYDFSGKKYIRVNSNKSVYNDYMDYVGDISKICGFDVKYDKLRIPSTKKNCLVGINMTNNQGFITIDENIKKMIKRRCETQENNINLWVENYAARTPTEKVKNCTQLDRTFLQTFVSTIVHTLLNIPMFVSKRFGSEQWNSGSKLHLNDLVKLLNTNDLKQLKSECGGLQTLLKNHRYIFEINNGIVNLRVPVTIMETEKYKEKPCWFFRYHPDGCINTSENCAYSHVKY